MNTIITKPAVTEERLARYLMFLDQLRESGITNMFGARPFLQQEYGELDDAQAAKVLAYWMATFRERHEED